MYTRFWLHRKLGKTDPNQHLQFINRGIEAATVQDAREHFLEMHFDPKVFDLMAEEKSPNGDYVMVPYSLEDPTHKFLLYRGAKSTGVLPGMRLEITKAVDLKEAREKFELILSCGKYSGIDRDDLYILEIVRKQTEEGYIAENLRHPYREPDAFVERNPTVKPLHAFYLYFEGSKLPIDMVEANSMPEAVHLLLKDRNKRVPGYKVIEVVSQRDATIFASN